MSEKYILHYFDIRGRAEPLRQIMAYGNLDWHDKRIPHSNKATIPTEVKEKSNFGQVPLLEMGNGKYLAQTRAIGRYLARKVNLAGKDDWEAAKIDEIVDACIEFSDLFSAAWDEQDSDKKKAIIDNAMKIGTKKFIAQFNNILVNNGNTYLVGKKLTWADIMVTNTIDFNQKLYNTNITDGHPGLKKLLETVFTADGIREWIARRPVTNM